MAADTASHPVHLRVNSSIQVGGVGGLAFVVVVVVQNLLRASAPPANATASQVASFYATHQTTSSLLAVLFVLSGIGLVTFSAAMADRLAHGDARRTAILGVIGCIGVVCLFATMLASDLALSRLVGAGIRGGDGLLALWTLHEAAFCVLLFAIAVALAGLSAAATAAGLIGPVWRPVGMAGSLLLALTAALSPQVLDGRPVLYLGFLGFAIWLCFVARSSVALLKEQARP
jgi:hypothetical protein